MSTTPATAPALAPDDERRSAYVRAVCLAYVQGTASTGPADLNPYPPAGDPALAWELGREDAKQPAAASGAARSPGVREINDLMTAAGWQNSAIRQADLPRVVKVVNAALAAAAQAAPAAPIGYVVTHGNPGPGAQIMDGYDARSEAARRGGTTRVMPVFTAAPAAQPQPVGWFTDAQGNVVPASAKPVPVAAPAVAHYPLPDDLYAGSKDWLHGDYAQRVEWLHGAYESTKVDRDALLEQLANVLVAAPALSIDEIRQRWDAQADKHNQWDALGLDEMLEFALQQHGIAAAPVDTTATGGSNA